MYTVQQAIEEGYILDVLLNYTTYDIAFKAAERSKEAIKAVKLVNEAEATEGLMRRASLHPSHISQEVRIIVEQYRANVRHLLDRRAKPWSSPPVVSTRPDTRKRSTVRNRPRSLCASTRVRSACPAQVPC